MRIGISFIALLASITALAPESANAACTPGGFVGYDGTTLTVDTTGCALKVQDSGTGTSSTFSAGALTQADSAGNTTSVVAGGLITANGSNVSYIVPGGVVSANSSGVSYMTPGGIATTDGTNAATVTPTSVNVFNGSNATSVYANGVATNGYFLASDGAGNFSQTTAYGTFVGDSAGNATLTTATGVWTTGTVVAAGPSSAGVVSSTAVGVVNANGGAGAGVQSNGQVAVGVVNSTGQSQFYASSDGTISAEGNRIQNVATPVAPSDAANKAYVDSGLTHLLNTEKADVKKLNGGVAASMALVSPDRTGGQTGAFAVSESFWNGHNATGFSAIQQIYNAGTWDFSLGGGFAIADTGDVGGRVTGQFAWGGSSNHLK